jgi:hypothetical protein
MEGARGNSIVLAQENTVLADFQKYINTSESKCLFQVATGKESWSWKERREITHKKARNVDILWTFFCPQILRIRGINS